MTELRTGRLASRRDFAKLAALSGYAALWARSAEAFADVPALPETPAAPGETFWRAVKAQFALPPDVAVLNAANLCPASVPVIDATVNAKDLDHDHSPANRARMHDAKEETRRRLAAFLRVSPEDVLITRNTSESNNLVSSGLDLKAGDEVVLFSDNHPSNNAAWREKAKRFGFEVLTVEQKNPHPGSEHYLEAFGRLISARTRVVAFTHLTNTAGDLFPAKELCRLARERGALSVLDGAQSFGLMDVDLSDIQPDFYSGSAHKWPCGPKETGVLYVSKAAQPRFWPTLVSAYPGALGLSKTHEGFGQRDEPAIAGFAEALRFQERIGRRHIEARARELGQAFIAGLRKLPGITLWTHQDPARSHAVVSFRPAGLDPRKLQDFLWEKHKVVCATRGGPDRGGLRFSPHFYNLHSEVERTLAALERALAQGL